jgi:protein-tyrosine-phosphatase/DNA-binding transcriptional ArsR family regulator
MYSWGVQTSTASTPPVFLRLAGHPVRWRILVELARSDRKAGELSALLGARQNLVSYHLGRLRAERVVSRRRSSADGRDSYYRADLERCRELLGVAGGALHPALRLTPPPSHASDGAGHARVLFLCTGNSARSQIAEAMLERATAGTATTASAGSHPKPLHPNAVAVMHEYGIDIAGRRSKHLSEFIGESWDHVITLCDRVREVCPELPGHPVPTHWSMDDPSRAGITDEASYPAFQRTAAEIEVRVRFLLHTLKASRPTTEVN